FSPLITVDIVPAQVSQASLERPLHPAQLFVGEEVWEDHDAPLVQLCNQAITHITLEQPAPYTIRDTHRVSSLEKIAQQRPRDLPIPSGYKPPGHSRDDRSCQQVVHHPPEGTESPFYPPRR